MKRWFAGTVFFFGLFLASYVLYAHVSSWRMALRIPSDWSSHLRKATLESDGFKIFRDGLDAWMVDEKFVVSGTSPRKGIFRLYRPSKRFDSATLSTRFRVGEFAAYDVFVGFQVAGDATRRVAFSFSNDESHRRFRLLGVGANQGPIPESDGVLDDLETIHDVAQTIHVGDWHEIAIRFDPRNQQFEFLLDSIPIATRRLGWMGGVDVEPVVGVEERTPGSNPHVAFDAISFAAAPSGPPPRGTRFVDDFPGSTPDPLRWQTTIANDWRMNGGLAQVHTGGGLHLEGSAAGVTSIGISTPVMLCLYPTELDPVHIETTWDIRTLRYAAIFVSISNEQRTFEVDIRAAGDGERRQWFFTGQSDGSIAPVRTEGPAIEAEGNNSLKLDVAYDPWLRRATVRSGGTVVHQKGYELSRKEYVRICVGGHISSGGAFDATLRLVDLHFAPY